MDQDVAMDQENFNSVRALSSLGRPLSPAEGTIHRFLHYDSSVYNKKTLESTKRSLEKALEETAKSKKNKRRKLNIPSTYNNITHPLTATLWREREPSDTIKKIFSYIEEMKIDEKNWNSLINFEENVLEFCKQTLLDPSYFNKAEQDNHDTKSQNFFPITFNSVHRCDGRSGAEIHVFTSVDPKVKMVVKKIKDVKKGIEELLSFLIALSLNPSVKIKMVGIYDAILHPEDGVCITMEGANGHDISKYLSSNIQHDVLRSVAANMAEFHITYHQQYDKKIDKRQYANHASKFHNTLCYNLLVEEAHKEIPLIPIPANTTFKSENRSNINFNGKVTCSNIIEFLSEKEKNEFLLLMKKTQNNFEENVKQILQSCNSTQHPFYIFPSTHGDAHIFNFFYEDSNSLMENEKKLDKDSPLRISIIDYATIMRTYRGIGDPAEDVGRFLGSLAEWVAQQVYPQECTNSLIYKIQKEFIEIYINDIKNRNIFTEKNQLIFEKIFRENCAFYMLRFYRVIFNSEQSIDIKLKILRSWLKMKAMEEASLKEISPNNILISKTPHRFWVPVSREINYYLPDPPEEFIESIAKRAGKSYLTFLGEILNNTNTATITGMGGVGKTSLALKYAYEALENKVYNMIYWLRSETEYSLIQGYKNLLSAMDISIKGLEDHSVIERVKEHLPKEGKCLLIYDNVPDPRFLEGMVPEGIHSLYTSRCNQGWENPLLNLDVFSSEESVRYLLNITGLEPTLENKKIAKELSKELGGLPLALSHAAHYIKLVEDKNVTGNSFRKYLENFEKTSLWFFEKHENPFKNESRKMSYENLVAKTFKISCQQLSGAAVKILNYCAYLDPDTISEEYFLENPEHKEALEKELSQLSSLSLIKRTRKDASFSLHRLVQLLTRNELEQKNIAQEFCSELASLFIKRFAKVPENYNGLVSDVLLNDLSSILKVIEYSLRLGVKYQKFAHIERLRWVGRVLYLIQDYYMVLSNWTYHNMQEKIKEKEIENLYKAPMHNSHIPGWLREVALCGPSIVKFVIGLMYDNGLYVAQNQLEAHLWYNVADQQEDRETHYCLGHLYKAAGEQAEAIEHFAVAAQQGDPNAIDSLDSYARDGYTIAQFYRGQVCVKLEEDSEAIEWYARASKKGYGEARLALLEYAKAKHKKAQFYLGQSYQELGIPSMAIHWLSKAAQQGHKKAQANLRTLCVNGSGVEQNDVKALKYFTSAAEQGYEGMLIEQSALKLATGNWLLR